MTSAALVAWREYLMAGTPALSTRDRQVVLRAVSVTLCDRGGVSAWESAEPSNDREQALARYATTLSLAPWRVGAKDLAALRAVGLDDATALTVISLSAHQNAIGRMHHGLAALLAS